jgi:pimeloyl-ACP methyl ester carboxylesterase
VSQISIEGVDVLIEGEGEDTVVMMHGWPDTHRLWDGQVAVLKGSHRCVRFTQPGFDPAKPARSPDLDELVRIYAAIVDHVSPGRPVTLLLHDWGCVFGYRFAQAYPERVEAIVGVDVGDAGSRAHLASLGPGAKIGMAGYQLCLALGWYLPAAWGDALTRRIARWASAPGDVAKVGAHMNYPYVVQWTGGYGRKPFVPHRPMLFVYGRRKPFMFHSAEWLEAVRATPGGEVLALETGHWVMREGEAEFDEALLRWIDGVKRSGGIWKLS